MDADVCTHIPTCAQRLPATSRIRTRLPACYVDATPSLDMWVISLGRALRPAALASMLHVMYSGGNVKLKFPTRTIVPITVYKHWRFCLRSNIFCDAAYLMSQPCTESSNTLANIRSVCENKLWIIRDSFNWYIRKIYVKLQLLYLVLPVGPTGRCAYHGQKTFTYLKLRTNFEV